MRPLEQKVTGCDLNGYRLHKRMGNSDNSNKGIGFAFIPDDGNKLLPGDEC
jgi:hypothetical protein